MRRTYRITALLVVVSLLLIVITLIAAADGTETLGPPSITIASGSGLVAAGVGMESQPAILNVEVPEDAVVQQVLLYWGGGNINPPTGDDTISVDGFSVTGTLIGGPAYFFSAGGEDYNFTAYRADITDLALIGAGDNVMELNDLVLTEQDGAGVIVIYDDGDDATIALRDGIDLAYLLFPEPRRTTVPQTFAFEASANPRVAEIAILAGSVEADRPNVIRITVGEDVTEYVDLLNSIDGPDWDTITVPIDVPAGATELTVEVQSIDDDTDRRPASLFWAAGAMAIQPPALGAIGDTVWEDLNANGVQDLGEPDLADVTLELLTPGADAECGTADDVLLESEVTDLNGRYLFGGLPADTYCVDPDETTVPTGYDLTTNNDPQTVDLDEGQNFLDADFGYRPPSGPLGSIGDTVWEDLDGNGVQDPDELGIANVTLNLTSPGADNVCGTADDAFLASQATDADGLYLFTDLEAGSYCVNPDETTVPADYTLTTANDPQAVALAESEDFLDADFGYQPPPPPPLGSIGDTVWEDLNGNATQEPDEPGIPNVTVNLAGPGTDGLCGTDDDAAIDSAVTDAAGLYLFSDLEAGGYCVNPDEATIPAGYVLTTANDPETVDLGESEDFLEADFGYQPAICADFSKLNPGDSVEGLGVLQPNLDISSNGGNAIMLLEGAEPEAYVSPNDNTLRVINGNLPEGGFTDATRGHNYTFTFEPGAFTTEDGSIAGFALRLVDFGDWNPNAATQMSVSLVGFDSDGNEVDIDTLAFSTDTRLLPRTGFWDGRPFNPYFQADAEAEPGEPGNYMLAVYGETLASATLRFSNNAPGFEMRPSDPLFAMKDICFVPPPPPPAECADFSALPAGASAEGLGTVLPGLNITTSGDAIVVLERDAPEAYASPNEPASRVRNGNVGPLGGVWDVDGEHDYVFTFEEGVTVDEFTLRALDFGDWNPYFAKATEISLVAYDGDGNVVDTDTLAFSFEPRLMPQTGMYLGKAFNPYLAADATTAIPGEPGNYRFEVKGEGIARVELQYDNDVLPGIASDPLFALRDVCFIAPQQ